MTTDDLLTVLLPELKPGSVTRLLVLHDDDCPRLRGRACRCAPALRLEGTDAAGNTFAYAVDEAGNLEVDA